jgi:hypothetical protein
MEQNKSGEPPAKKKQKQSLLPFKPIVHQVKRDASEEAPAAPLPQQLCAQQLLEADFPCTSSSATNNAARESCHSLLPVSLDIGIVVEKLHGLTDLERLQLLNLKWHAPQGFSWPFSERRDGNKTRRKYLGPQHFVNKLDVFTYSFAKQGIYCKPCALFGPESVRGVKLDRLVKAPLTKFAHLTGSDGYLTCHLATSFHEDSVARANAFRQVMANTANGSIDAQLNSAALAQREKNRQILKRIILAIEYHGRLGLALRGHRDAGELPLHLNPAVDKCHNIDYSQGNLRALLQMMVQCDDCVLKEHFMSAGKNATYISPCSQNDLIESMATVIKHTIVLEVKEARFFSLLADETTDFSKKEQLTICLRYVKQNRVCERFFQFDVATDLTGFGLANHLINLLENAGIDIANMVGQGYDGAAAMSGEKNGVQTHVLQRCPSAAYVHCAAHALNLCLAKASDVQEIKAAITLMNDIAVFFNDSNNRLENLHEFIESECPEATRTHLKRHCATRWVEKQEAVFTFKQLMPAVIASLLAISKWRKDYSGKASIYLRAMDGCFFIALEIIDSVLEITKPLSVKLQSASQDIHTAVTNAMDCLSVLQKYRSEEEIFKKIFARGCAIAEKYDEDVFAPRQAKTQKHRSNVPAGSVEEYYKRSMFYPFVDTCIGQVTERFRSHSAKACMVSVLLPAYCCSSNYSSLEKGAEFYQQFLPSGLNALETEFLRWQAYWQRQPVNQRTDGVCEALEIASELGTYPSIAILLRIFATIPVTTATGERSFSALKYIKNYLRSTMGETRLNGLAHLYINRDIELNYEAVIDDFGRKNRRLNFV